MPPTFAQLQPAIANPDFRPSILATVSVIAETQSIHQWQARIVRHNCKGLAGFIQQKGPARRAPCIVMIPIGKTTKESRCESQLEFAEERLLYLQYPLVQMRTIRRAGKSHGKLRRF